jgi:prepilin-type N-terminal cleavage/methylation domain-containing protein
MQGKRGFTLTEMLVVIAIIVVLVSILFPVMGVARRSVKKTVCLNKMGQLAHALALYRIDNEGWPDYQQTGVTTDEALRPYLGDTRPFWELARCSLSPFKLMNYSTGQPYWVSRYYTFLLIPRNTSTNSAALYGKDNIVIVDNYHGIYNKRNYIMMVDVNGGIRKTYDNGPLTGY